ncbi:MOSC domain-containing protein [Micromonospora terminaliae]|uniref:MOSC domain-containing protein n=1 Tax=Micromonospora terminaliae TaxID=1914461 RepID=UPI001FCBF4EE|nr:MOSC domain-containing protein [Micromonospora terminaliae]
MIGRVVSIRRYPVKSLLGEELDAVAVDAAGLAGDRRLALLHRETGRVASAKNPYRWRTLTTLRATGGDGTVRIALPDGRSVAAGDDGVDDVLSEVLGAPVTLTGTPPPDAVLERSRPEEVLAAGVAVPVPVEEGRLGGAAPAGGFVDFAPVHLLTTATLRRIGAELPSGAVDPVRYRPNLVLDTTGAGFEENDWPGRELRIGDDLVLRVLARTPRCAVPTLAHGSLPRDPEALRVPARLNRVVPLDGLAPQPCMGAYAQVVRAGLVRSGDPVRLA